MKEEYREKKGLPAIETLVPDIRAALRNLKRNPAFAVTVVVSLALGIGANTAIFSFVNAILLKTLPAPHPERLALVRERVGLLGMNDAFGYPFFRELERRNEVFTGMLAAFDARVNLEVGRGAEQVQEELVSGGFFRTLGAPGAGTFAG